MEKVEALLLLLREICPKEEGLEFEFKDLLKADQTCCLTLDVRHVPSKGAMRFRRDSDDGFTEAEIVDFIQTCIAKMMLWAIEWDKNKVEQTGINGKV